MAKTDKPFVVTTQRQAAEFFGVSQPAICTWFKRGCPQLRGKKYDLAAMAKWAVGQRYLVGSVSDEISDGDMGEGSSPALEDYRRERAKMARLQRLQLEGDLVEIAKIEAGMLSVAARIREAGEKLQRLYGPDAQQILDECMDAADRELADMFAEKKPAE